MKYGDAEHDNVGEGGDGGGSPVSALVPLLKHQGQATATESGGNPGSGEFARGVAKLKPSDAMGPVEDQSPEREVRSTNPDSLGQEMCCPVYEPTVLPCMLPNWPELKVLISALTAPLSAQEVGRVMGRIALLSDDSLGFEKPDFGVFAQWLEGLGPPGQEVVFRQLETIAQTALALEENKPFLGMHALECSEVVNLSAPFLSSLIAISFLSAFKNKELNMSLHSLDLQQDALANRVLDFISNFNPESFEPLRVSSECWDDRVSNADILNSNLHLPTLRFGPKPNNISAYLYLASLGELNPSSFISRPPLLQTLLEYLMAPLFIKHIEKNQSVRLVSEDGLNLSLMGCTEAGAGVEELLNRLVNALRMPRNTSPKESVLRRPSVAAVTSADSEEILLDSFSMSDSCANFRDSDSEVSYSLFNREVTQRSEPQVAGAEGTAKQALTNGPGRQSNSKSKGKLEGKERKEEEGRKEGNESEDKKELGKDKPRQSGKLKKRESFKERLKASLARGNTPDIESDEPSSVPRPDKKLINQRKVSRRQRSTGFRVSTNPVDDSDDIYTGTDDDISCMGAKPNHAVTNGHVKPWPRRQASETNTGNNEVPELPNGPPVVQRKMLKDKSFDYSISSAQLTSTSPGCESLPTTLSSLYSDSCSISSKDLGIPKLKDDLLEDLCEKLENCVETTQGGLEYRDKVIRHIWTSTNKSLSDTHINLIEDIERIFFLPKKEFYQTRQLELLGHRSFSAVDLRGETKLQPTLKPSSSQVLPLLLSTQSLGHHQSEVTLMLTWIAAAFCGIPAVYVVTSSESQLIYLQKTTTALQNLNISELLKLVIEFSGNKGACNLSQFVENHFAIK